MTTLEAASSSASSNGTGRPLLEVDDIVTWFNTPRGVIRAVDGVSFSLRAGETLGIVGESGSGKSVLMRSVMNLLPSSAVTPNGRVFFDGVELRSLSRKQASRFWGREIAMIFQDPMTSLNPVVKIERQLTESMKLHLGLDGAGARKRALELLEQVGIPEPARRLKQYPHELSGGMRQRVCIAIALSCKPRLLIADEPTTALDVTIQRQILDLLSDIQRDEGMAMVLITHNMGVVAGQADRIMVMYGGRVAETGPAVSLFQETRHPYTSALLRSIPKLDDKSHTRLETIPGRPINIVNPGPGCRFAARCLHGQARCVEEEPAPTPAADPQHEFACFYPVGTPAGVAALQANADAGVTGAGLVLEV